VPLIARNEDVKSVSAWEMEEIALLSGGNLPEDLDDLFPGLRYLTEPGQKSISVPLVPGETDGEVAALLIQPKCCAKVKKVGKLDQPAAIRRAHHL
jgi:hypothetical protein